MLLRFHCMRAEVCIRGESRFHAGKHTHVSVLCHCMSNTSTRKWFEGQRLWYVLVAAVALASAIAGRISRILRSSDRDAIARWMVLCACWCFQVLWNYLWIFLDIKNFDSHINIREITHLQWLDDYLAFGMVQLATHNLYNYPFLLRSNQYIRLYMGLR